jgi:hypothetical protein
MARRPTLEIDGVQYKNVYEVTYTIYTAKDDTGRPSDRAHAGTIKVARESDDNSDIARWAMDSSQPNWKAGKVIFKDPKSESTMKELSWEEGFITMYEEFVPHIRNSPDEQMYEYFEISCHRLNIGDAQIDNRWEE